MLFSFQNNTVKAQVQFHRLVVVTPHVNSKLKDPPFIFSISTSYLNHLYLVLVDSTFLEVAVALTLSLNCTFSILSNRVGNWFVSPAPHRRLARRHTAAFVNQRMFVLFGGDDTRVYDDVHVFDAERNAWQELATTGTRPGARWGHTMCVLPDRRLLVFGGHDGENMLNDLHILDTDSLVWTRLHTSTADSLVPPPRAGHTASMVNRTMIVFGGGDGDSLLNDCWSLTLDAADDTPHWHRLVASGAPPSARCAHTSITLPPRSDGAIDAYSARVLVFGGGDGARRFKDVYELDVHRVVEGISPATRSAAAAAAAPAPPVTTAVTVAQRGGDR
jgi:hypothetical protein